MFPSRQATSTGQRPQLLYSGSTLAYQNGHHFPCQEEMWV